MNPAGVMTSWSLRWSLSITLHKALPRRALLSASGSTGEARRACRGAGVSAFTAFTVAVLLTCSLGSPHAIRIVLSVRLSSQPLVTQDSIMASHCTLLCRNSKPCCKESKAHEAGPDWRKVRSHGGLRENVILCFVCIVTLQVVCIQKPGLGCPNKTPA